jgi:hypothetical protein
VWFLRMRVTEHLRMVDWRTIGTLRWDASFYRVALSVDLMGKSILGMFPQAGRRTHARQPPTRPLLGGSVVVRRVRGAGCTTPPVVSAVACCRMLAEVPIESYPRMVNR